MKIATTFKNFSVRQHHFSSFINTQKFYQMSHVPLGLMIKMTAIDRDLI